MFAAVPFRRIYDFGKNEGGRDRIEHLVEIKHARPIGPARRQIGEIFLGAPLGNDARHHVRRPAASRSDFDERKFFVERRDDIGVGDLLPAVERELAFFFCRLHRPLPFACHLGSSAAYTQISQAQHFRFGL